jgi:hypothetical protein
VGKSLARESDLVDTRTSELIAYSSKGWSFGIEARLARAYRERHMKSQIKEIARERLSALGTIIAKFSNGDGIHPPPSAGSTAFSSPSRTCSCPPSISRPSA